MDSIQATFIVVAKGHPVPTAALAEKNKSLLFGSLSALAQPLLEISSYHTRRGEDRMKVEQLKSSSPKTGVIVHIDELLDEEHRQNIESIVAQVEGVAYAHFNETRHHLMIVGYDPQRTSAATILGRVKRQHLHAQLV